MYFEFEQHNTLCKTKPYEGLCIGNLWQVSIYAIAATEVCTHFGLHTLFDEMTLGTKLNTITLLQENPIVAKHCQWVSRQQT